MVFFNLLRYTQQGGYVRITSIYYLFILFIYPNLLNAVHTHVQQDINSQENVSYKQ